MSHSKIVHPNKFPNENVEYFHIPESIQDIQLDISAFDRTDNIKLEDQSKLAHKSVDTTDKSVDKSVELGLDFLTITGTNTQLTKSMKM